jgi:hypothetical protein
MWEYWGGRGRSQGEGPESRPGSRCNEFPLYFLLFWGRVSRRRPYQTVTTRRRVYMPWSQAAAYNRHLGMKKFKSTGNNLSGRVQFCVMMVP